MEQGSQSARGQAGARLRAEGLPGPPRLPQGPRGRPPCKLRQDQQPGRDTAGPGAREMPHRWPQLTGTANWESHNTGWSGLGQPTWPGGRYDLVPARPGAQSSAPSPHSALSPHPGNRPWAAQRPPPASFKPGERKRLSAHWEAAFADGRDSLSPVLSLAEPYSTEETEQSSFTPGNRPPSKRTSRVSD